jgi:hypothetical protein
LVGSQIVYIHARSKYSKAVKKASSIVIFFGNDASTCRRIF